MNKAQRLCAAATDGAQSIVVGGLLAALLTLTGCGGGNSADTAEANAADDRKSALAAAGGGGGGTGSSGPGESIYSEAGKLVRTNQTVEAVGNDMFGERVNLYNGTVEFVQSDFSLPGHSALPMALGRRMTTGNSQTGIGPQGAFGDWDIEIPRIQGIFSKAAGWTVPGSGAAMFQRCSQYWAPPWVMGLGGGMFNADEYWHGNTLYVPGVGAQEILRRGSGVPAPTDGQSWPLVTKSQWTLRCVPLQRGTGEGFVAVSPDGTQYQFDWMVSRTYAPLRRGTPSPNRPTSGQAGDTRTEREPAPNRPDGYFLQRQEIAILPTVITDRFGNRVRFTYDPANPWNVTRIEGDDPSGSPRVITLTYGVGGVSSASNGSSTWQYRYSSSGSLTNVIRPDGSQWQFNLSALATTPPMSQGTGACAEDGDPEIQLGWFSGTITHPSGATGVFTLAGTQHARAGVYKQCRGEPGADYSLYPLFIDAFSIRSKTITGPGLPNETWNYSYSQAVASFYPCSGCVQTKTVDIADPRGVTTRHTFGTLYQVNEGQLLRVDEGWNGAGAERITTHEYRLSGGGAYADFAGIGIQPRTYNDLSQRNVPEERKVTYQQGASFTWQALAFDVFARPTVAQRFSSLNTGRTERTDYYDHLGKWVLGQKAAVTELNTNKVIESSAFYGDSANVATHVKFGVLQNAFGYRADGNLQWRSDGAGKTTWFDAYKRGLAQYAVYADGTWEWAAVNDQGLIDSVRNAAGFTTSYAYDSMGRLRRITQPTGNPTLLAFEQVWAWEQGLEPGHWRQTVTTGNAVTTRFFDGKWRGVVSRTSDAANDAATVRMVQSRFDVDGRKVFESNPVRATSFGDMATPGTRWYHDALGRVVLQQQDSEFGALNTITDYLGNMTRRVTNPRGYATTYAYAPMDSPSEDNLVAVWAAEGVVVGINRDVFGKPLAISRSGNGASATRSYAYDAGERLCKTIEPESGATVQDYDAAGNVAWRASGVAAIGAICDRWNVPGTRKINHSYDARNRLVTTTYGDGSPGISRSYTPDGLLQRITAGYSNLSYQYDERRNLVREQDNLWGWYYHWARNANGHVAGYHDPWGNYIDHAPNALGEPTQVGGYASNVRYHPNGAVAGYTLGNGINRSVTLNLRGLPEVIEDAGVLRQRYAYDANGNPASITDERDGSTTRSMPWYDGLDRLRQANGPWGTASYGYDALDNLVASTVGGRSLTHTIDPATNRLASISGSQFMGFAYDANGNVAQRGGQAFTFDIGNRLTAANGVSSHDYDGHGRRHVTWLANGGLERPLYARDGLHRFGYKSSEGSRRYVYLGSHLIAEHGEDDVRTYQHADALGSPVARTGASGNVISRTLYEPYGATAAGTNPSGIGFTGHANDVATGLVYMQQRYYDPIAGRFLSVDPVTTNAGDGSFFNRYVYANNNPYKFKDPDGNSPAHAAAFVLGFAIDVGAQMLVEGKSFGDVSFGDAALSGLGAAITGGIGGRFATAAMQGAITTGQAVAGTAAAGAVAGAGVSAASDLSKGQAPSAAKMAIGAAGGAAGAAAGAKIANSAAAKLASDAAKPGVAGHIGQTTQAAAQQGGKVVVPTSVGQEVGKAGADAAAAGASKLAEKELVK